MMDPRTVMYEEGRRQALALQSKAPDMTGTELISSESNIPAWSSSKDYTKWPMGAPVTDEGQVWILLAPHNSAHYMGRPSGLRSLWGLAHTTDPSRAKPWIAPYGTSGLYMSGECCTENGAVFRSTQDNNPYAPSEFPKWWQQVTE